MTNKWIKQIKINYLNNVGADNVFLKSLILRVSVNVKLLTEMLISLANLFRRSILSITV